MRARERPKTNDCRFGPPIIQTLNHLHSYTNGLISVPALTSSSLRPTPEEIHRLHLCERFGIKYSNGIVLLPCREECIAVTLEEKNALEKYLPNFANFDGATLVEKLVQLMKKIPPTTKCFNDDDKSISSITKQTAIGKLPKEYPAELMDEPLLPKDLSFMKVIIQTNNTELQMENLKKENKELRFKVNCLRNQVDKSMNSNIKYIKELKENIRDEILTFRKTLLDNCSLSMVEVIQKAMKENQTISHLNDQEITKKKCPSNAVSSSLKGRIQVFCRIRPLRRDEGSTTLYFPSNNSLVFQEKEYSFDHVFSPDKEQGSVYNEVESLVYSVLDGFHACILAYGQTGTGKTHTMFGENLDGVVPRSLKDLFSCIEKRSASYEYEVALSMVQIYNEQLYDLLAMDATGSTLDIKWVSNNIVVPGLIEKVVINWEQVYELLHVGSRSRVIASTELNNTSSRSHTLLFVRIKGTKLSDSMVTNGKLCFVDLAGSERLSKSLVSGEHLKETKCINKSLASLGNVCHALQYNAKHVPYRNSKLTFLLQEMLSKGTKTLMMLQISPSLNDVSETLCSLQFGARVSKVMLGSVKRNVESNEIKRRDQLIQTLREKNQELQNQINLLQIDPFEKTLHASHMKTDTIPLQEDATMFNVLDEKKDEMQQVGKQLEKCSTACISVSTTIRTLYSKKQQVSTKVDAGSRIETEVTSSYSESRDVSHRSRLVVPTTPSLKGISLAKPLPKKCTNALSTIPKKCNNTLSTIPKECNTALSTISKKCNAISTIDRCSVEKKNPLITRWRRNGQIHHSSSKVRWK